MLVFKHVATCTEKHWVLVDKPKAYVKILAWPGASLAQVREAIADDLHNREVYGTVQSRTATTKL